MLSAEETRTMLKHAQDGARRYKIMPVAAVPIPPCVVDRKPFPAVRFAGCSAATNDAYFTLDPLGNVRMCNHSPVILGNILDQPFMEIANSKDADDWREVRPDFCKPCPGWSRCKGGCRAVVQQQGKPLTTLDPYVDMNVDKSRF
jgi:radical SAM protein with 4Fe4S-binding SPASM domain